MGRIGVDGARRTDIRPTHTTQAGRVWCASQAPGSWEAKVMPTDQARFAAVLLHVLPRYLND